VRESLAGHFAVAINITGISQLVHVELFSPILTCPFYSFAVILYPNSHSLHTYTHCSAPLILSPLSSPCIFVLQWGAFGAVIYLDEADVLSLVAGQNPGECTVLVCLLSWPWVSSKCLTGRLMTSSQCSYLSILFITVVVISLFSCSCI